jgi:hypothetical protein
MPAKTKGVGIKLSALITRNYSQRNLPEERDERRAKALRNSARFWGDYFSGS